MTKTYVDIHILQTVPPSNVNRDDTGSPKTAVFGGVRRARVSSQAWKRATRREFETYLDRSDLGVRSLRVVELLAEEITAQDDALETRAAELAKAALTAAKIVVKPPRKGEGPDVSGYLLFLSHLQVTALAREAVAAAHDDRAVDGARAKALLKGQNSIDVALFGRMVADVTDLNVDACAQVAHAISIHAVDNEFDYFTAVDDHKQQDAEEDAGAGMIGTVEFNSSTLYRYATVNVPALASSLGDSDATIRATTSFVRSFVSSMPTGKQNTFANRTLPDAVVVCVRSDQPVSYAGAFEEPVVAHDSSGLVGLGAGRLAAYAKDVANAYGTAPTHTWVVGVGDRTAPLDQLGQRVSFERLLALVAETIPA